MSLILDMPISFPNQVYLFWTILEKEGGSLVIVTHCCSDIAGHSTWSKPLMFVLSVHVQFLDDKISLFNKGQKLTSYQHSVSDLLKELRLCRELANDIIEKALIASKIQYLETQNLKDALGVI